MMFSTIEVSRKVEVDIPPKSPTAAQVMPAVALVTQGPAGGY
jgi:hypothetical protein